ncbi:hypothetical protein Trydic_g1584 [Trypoxylus dichotomus]
MILFFHSLQYVVRHIYGSYVSSRLRKSYANSAQAPTYFNSYDDEEYYTFIEIKDLPWLSLQQYNYVQLVLALARRSRYPIKLGKRPTTLKVCALAGCVSKADTRLSNTDAVIALNLLEHLYSDALDALPYNVFQFMKPYVAVFTITNKECRNLPSFDSHPSSENYLFNWTKEQFRSWAKNVITRFPNYTVKFDYILLPSSPNRLECTTEIAIFLRSYTTRDKLTIEIPFGICTYFAQDITFQKPLSALDGTFIFYQEVDSFICENDSIVLTYRECLIHDTEAALKKCLLLENKYDYPLHTLRNELVGFYTLGELSNALEKVSVKLTELPGGTLCVSTLDGLYSKNEGIIVHSYTDTNPSIESVTESIEDTETECWDDIKQNTSTMNLSSEVTEALSDKIEELFSGFNIKTAIYTPSHTSSDTIVVDDVNIQVNVRIRKTRGEYTEVDFVEENNRDEENQSENREAGPSTEADPVDNEAEMQSEDKETSPPDAVEADSDDNEDTLIRTQQEENFLPLFLCQSILYDVIPTEVLYSDFLNLEPEDVEDDM